MAPNEGRNNWCHFELRDFDFETFRDFFRLQDQKTSGAKARWHSLEGRPALLISKLTLFIDTFNFFPGDNLNFELAV